MFKIQRFFLMMIMMSGCLSHLAAKITTEFRQLGEFSEMKDITILRLIDWPINTYAHTSEKQLLLPESKKLHSLKATEKGTYPILVVSSVGYFPGVPVTYTFENIEKGLKEEITVVPNRVLVKSLIDNAQIEAKLISEYPAMYHLDLEGFGKEELTLKSVSYGEVLGSKFPINEKSMTIYTPGVIGKEGGIGRISFTRASGEVLKLELPWGVEWMKHHLYYDENGKPKPSIEHPNFPKLYPEMFEYFNSER